MFSFLRKGLILLITTGGFWPGFCQTPASPILMPGCPECALAEQTPDRNPLASPQVEYLEDPKPFSFAGLREIVGRRVDVHLELTARVISTRPLVLDVLDAAGPKGMVPDPSCGLMVIALVDAKLKGVLSQLVFNQMVRATLFYGGNAEFPHEMVLSGLTLDVSAKTGGEGCFNRSGLLLSYRGLVEYVNVYNDGSIYYQDPMFNGYGMQKLSSDELAQLLRAFAENGFDTLPSSPPPMNVALNKYSLTLICSRFQNVLLSGLENKLAPLLSRLEDLKVRATSQTFYQLLFKDRIKQTVLKWPFPQFPLSQLVAGRWRDAKTREAMKASVPEVFLSHLPLTYTGVGSPEDPNRYVYCTDAGKMYLATRPPCGGGRPHCNTFDDLIAYEIQRAEELVARTQNDPKNLSGPILASSPLAAGVLWPSDVGVKLAQIGSQGMRITNLEYKKHFPLFFDLFIAGSSGFGVNLIQDGYLYRGVRICRVDPEAKATRCTNPDAKTY